LSVILFWRGGWVCCIGEFGGVSELSVILFFGGSVGLDV